MHTRKSRLLETSSEGIGIRVQEVGCIGMNWQEGWRMLGCWVDNGGVVMIIRRSSLFQIPNLERWGGRCAFSLGYIVT